MAMSARSGIAEGTLAIQSPAVRHAMEDSTMNPEPEIPSPEDEAAALFGMAIDPVGERAGDKIGNFTLIEPLGEGGFGRVWLASQERPVKRLVALKILKPGMDTDEVVRRFQEEWQSLALMDHPGIARMFDAGITAFGRPFFTMEFVRGQVITDYCDERRLSLTNRLRLLIKVCLAVQHAHQKGVIHRDLKPSNILVCDEDGVPSPRVIDFGVARALGPEAERGFITRFDQVIGTAGYMSPEQLEAGGPALDTRTDIYSLGVILYEMLTGTPPFEVESLARTACKAVLWKVLEETPPQPSRRATSVAADRLSVIAMRRGLKPERLGAALRGDLDWIALKCLEKDRQRRYDTVGALVLDLRHHLEDRPVGARPPDLAYLLGRAIRRNRLAFSLGFISLAALLAGAGVSSAFFLQERSARIHSERLRREAELARDSATKARDSSEEMIAWILRDLRPGLMALGRLDLLEGIGITVEEHYQRLPPRNQSAATRLRHCEILFLNANVLFQRNQLHKAIKLYEEGLGIVERVVAEEPDNDLAARLHLAFVTTLGDALGGQGGAAECLAMRRRSVELARVLAAGEPASSIKQRGLCISLRKLAQVLMSDGQGDAARATMDECVAWSARTCPEHLPFALQIQADWQRQAGWHQTAIRTYRRAIAGFAKLEDEAPDNIHTLRYGVQCHIAMARSLFRLGRKEDARDELATARRISGRFRRIDPTNGDVLGDLGSISHVSGMFHAQEGNDARAETDFREALEIFAGLSRTNPAFVAWHDALVRLSVSAEELAAKPGASRSARVLAADVHLTAGECRSLGRQMEHVRAAVAKAKPFVEELMREAAADAVCHELDRRLRALAYKAGG